VSLRLASVNLFSGRSLRDGLVDHDRVTSGLAALDADVVALQEVDRGQARSGGADQTAVAAAALGDGTAHRFVPLVAGTPGEPGWTRLRDRAAQPPARGVVARAGAGAAARALADAGPDPAAPPVVDQG